MNFVKLRTTIGEDVLYHSRQPRHAQELKHIDLRLCNSSDDLSFSQFFHTMISNLSLFIVRFTKRVDAYCYTKSGTKY